MRKRLLSVAASAALLSMGVQAKSVGFKNIYSLGDSLSDVGTYSNAVIGGAALQVRDLAKHTVQVHQQQLGWQQPSVG